MIGGFMSPRKRKISKLERIPKIGSVFREIVLERLTEFPDYENTIASPSGRCFFTKDELELIEIEHKAGITWDEIGLIMLEKKGTIPKYATFRKYIQDGIIPKAIGYKSTGNGRVAIYEPNIITHLNFVNFFYDVTNATMIDNLMDMIDKLMEITKDIEITYNDAIESVLGGSGFINVELAREIAFDEYEVSDAINNVLATQGDKIKVLEMIDKIKNKYNKYVSKDIAKFIEYLKAKKMLISQIPEDESQQMREVLP
jgi:hypothetical protein